MTHQMKSLGLSQEEEPTEEFEKNPKEFLGWGGTWSALVNSWEGYEGS
jgi:hypothetical protein